MAALRHLEAHAAEYHLNLGSCFPTGDSAGALLCLFALSLNSSEMLQQAFGISGTGIPFRAAGLIFIMLDTQRRDLLCAIRNVVTDRNDRGKPYEKNLLDPALLVGDAGLPSLFLVTSAEDLIRRDTLKFDRLLTERHVEHSLLDFPKGVKGRKLVHVFSVMYPMYPESRDVFKKMNRYFQEVL